MQLPKFKSLKLKKLANFSKKRPTETREIGDLTTSEIDVVEDVVNSVRDVIEETRDEKTSTLANENETVMNTSEGTFESDKVEDTHREKENKNQIFDDHLKPETECRDSCSLDDITVEQPYDDPAQHRSVTCMQHSDDTSVNVTNEMSVIIARHPNDDEDVEEEDVDDDGDETVTIVPDDSIGEESQNTGLPITSLRELSLKPKIEGQHQSEPKTGYFCGLF
mmetsp:Transcript_52014/g.62585  ORF Transcript_52014/g.62585 Transcript_52014/m.62585 type:complete len:222 (+) Transcript_52014:57-722(+)|eukprot:CAMPEP_0172517726 /NCGR_PEP_ID=MMETSP1066-20121228/287431_1 /TAXON_ID=671091 /ORGANISM="Coscinodiscus wailesii, Strain CCMP2513" /LENGTH=221 /DNA_ID=CAMNT_0013299877 /DNA_START=50 /DNA_END=715 /DNA_ORIENTATION=+